VTTPLYSHRVHWQWLCSTTDGYKFSSSVTSTDNTVFVIQRILMCNVKYC